MNEKSAVVLFILVILVLATLSLILPNYAYYAHSWGGGELGEQKQIVNNLKILIEEFSVLIKMLGIGIIMLGLFFAWKIIDKN
jgi:hypothetical protein